MRDFNSLSEKEVLALAISLEEEDERIYADFVEGLRQNFPGSAAVFDGMRAEESGHRRRLLELYRQKFGEHIPLVRRQDVKGFVQRQPVWLLQPLNLEKIRNQASAMEVETRRFYERAAASALWAWLRTAHRQGVQVLIADASRPFAPTAGVRCLWEERLATAWAWEGTHARTVRLLTLDV